MAKYIHLVLNGGQSASVVESKMTFDPVEVQC